MKKTLTYLLASIAVATCVPTLLGKTLLTRKKNGLLGEAKLCQEVGGPTRSSCALLCPCPTGSTACYCRTIKFYPIRSVGCDKSRYLVGSVGHLHQYKIEPSYAVLNTGLGYSHSFRPQEILLSLFGGDIVQVAEDGNNYRCAQNCPGARSIVIQGSVYQDDDRNPRAWLADQLYLPINYESIVTFHPVIANWTMPVELYIGLDAMFPGLYLRSYGMITHANWRAGMCECIIHADERNNHPTGYFATEEVSEAKLLQCFESYSGGNTPGPLDGDIDSSIIMQPLEYSRITRSDREKTGFADLTFEVGVNMFQTPSYHLGFYGKGVAPTATKREPCYLFEPVIGNNGHLEAGAGISASYVFWLTRDGESHLGFYLDASATHVFNTKQFRTLELKDKPNSAYMLAAKFEQNGTVENPAGGTFLPVGVIDVGGGNTATLIPSHQFALEYAPVANLSTIVVDVGADAQIDVAAMFNLSSYGYSFDIGYNFWMRIREQMTATEGQRDPRNDQALTNIPELAGPRWVLKGDSRMFGYIQQGSDESNPVPLTPTQSLATIRNGMNQVVMEAPTLFGATDINRNVDDASLAFIYNTSDQLMNGPSTAPAQNQINTSYYNNAPRFKLLDHNDVDAVKTNGQSHKFFTHFHVTRDGENITVNGGIGASVEFGLNGNSAQPLDDLDRSNPERINVSLSQWCVWLKAGITFNGFTSPNKEVVSPT